jgi:ribulose 1,5-bisphosphate carboxylase large subunit-like protein
MKFKTFNPDHICDNYIVVSYFLRSSKSLRDAAWNIATGQSFGNPSVRSIWETEELYKNHSCVVLANEASLENVKDGNVNIAFPLANIDLDQDGITHLLVQIMGGQLDIDSIQSCQILDIEFPNTVKSHFYQPKFGITGIRAFTKSLDRPIFGGIVKPKIGVTPEKLLDIVKELVEGGVNFIKEDEIMSNPAICPLRVRVPMIAKYLTGKNVIFAHCINSDYPYVIDRVKFIHQEGGNAVHINFWNGLGVYKSVRELDLPLFLFFQKSGDKILTNKRHDFHIRWSVICKLTGLMGVDFIHAGMWGGYSDDDEVDLKNTLSILKSNNIMASLSCGMHPGLVEAIKKRFGDDIMMNVGGAIHGHPGGTLAGCKAMRQAIDRKQGSEYEQAIQKWGLIQ